jgi:CRISPR-associated endonuclease Csn1
LKRSELEQGKEDILPWEDFDKETRLRTSQLKDSDNVSIWRDQFRDLYKNQGDFAGSITPIFVSRMPKRNGTGQAHKETIRSPKVKDGDQRTTRKRLSDIHLKDLDNSVLPESDKVLYEQLKELLEKNGGDPKKAFSETYIDTDGKQKTRPLKIYKGDKSVDKNGQPISPVSTIKVYSTEPSGFFVNDGRAFVNNGSMIRLDVYRRVSAKHKVEHFFVPVYAHQAKTGSTKILPTPKIDGKVTTDVGENFKKVCSLYPNDYVRCEFADETGKMLKVQEGYYVKYGSASGQLNIISHSAANKESLINVSPRSATTITRYDVSVLGDNYKWD